MSDTPSVGEPMDLDNSETESNGNTKNVTGNEYNFNCPLDEKKPAASSKQLESSTLQNNLSETPAPELAEHENTTDVEDSKNSHLAKDRMQIIASAVPRDRPVATVSVVCANNRSFDNPDSCNVSTRKSNDVKDANGTQKRTYSDILIYGMSSNDRECQRSSLDTAEAPAQSNDSTQIMISSILATAEHPKQVKKRRLNIKIYQPNPSDLPSTKKTDARTRVESSTKNNWGSRPNETAPNDSLRMQAKQTFTASNGKGRDFEGARGSRNTSQADGGRESDTHRSNSNQPSGSKKSKWQNGNLHHFDSESSDSESSDSDQVTTEDDYFSDIEDLISGLKEFKCHKWVPFSTTHRLLVGRHGSWYDGDFDGNCMSGFGSLFSYDKRQFVQGSWTENRLVNLQSCQFIDQGVNEGTIYLRKQANSYLLTIDDDEFVARAQLRVCSKIVVDFASSFRSIKLAFLGNLTITNVINDRVKLNRQSALCGFEKALKEVMYDTKTSVDFASTLITLRKFLKETSSRLILTELTSNSSLPSILRKAAADLLKVENMQSKRRLELFTFSRDSQPPKLHVNSIVQSMYAGAIRHHRQRLVDKCPTVLPKLIVNINEVISEKIIYVSRSDIELFHHMASLTTEHRGFFEYLHRGFFEKLDKLDCSCPTDDIMPLTTPVYGFLFKSFLEICSEICLLAEDCSIETMLTQSDGEWKLLDEILWDQERKQSRRLLSTQESLDCQYRFIYKLLLHFEPKNYYRDKKFSYDFKVMVSDNPVDNWYLKQFKKLKNRFIGKMDFADVPEDRRVWLYILDHTIHKVLFDNKSNCKSSLALIKPMLDGHVTFVSSCPTNSWESFRMVTHNILLFIIQTYPHFEDNEKLADEDLVILEKQMKYISSISIAMKSDELAASDFRNLVNEYNRFWKLRHLITLGESDCPDYLISKIKRVHKVLLQMVDTALEKTVPVTSLVNYFRELNDFMEDLKDIDFPTIWYVKSDIDLAGMVEKIDNKIASESKCSYKVIDLKTFTERFKDGSPPEHYIIHVVQKLLECTSESLSKNWISSCDQSEAQLEGTGALLGAMRSSFLYLKEQPDYRDFELFCEESVQPFIRVINDCNVLKEFKTRVNIVKESFWYIRKMDEIGVVQALQMFNKINNGSLNTEKLEKCYNTYLKKYNEYIGDANSENSVNNIVQSMNHSKDFKKFAGVFGSFEEWSDDFKLVQIPEILAGLGAVWSLLVSKDVSSTGKFLKPHCIQILCIMRLLSVDNTKRGVEHHLAQVLTGQGKSVILGLLSAFLAFTGYKVSVVCYSSYLAGRDSADFVDFYRAFNVEDNITYATFQDMSERLFMNSQIDGRKIKLRGLVQSLVLEHRSWKDLGPSNSDVKKTVLLVDEVDVFFSKNVYGSSYRAACCIAFQALTHIQEKIWTTVCDSDHSPPVLYNIITAFIDEKIKSGNEEFKEYNEFRLKPGRFSVLDDDSDNLVVKWFTNQSLLETHVKKMIDSAIIVSKRKYRTEYEIINGQIFGKDPINGDLTSYVGYTIIFEYFKLEQTDYDHMNFTNYGYIYISCGRISYAKLPEDFPLILGVSGTLSNLRDHENEAIKSYKIHSLSVLPSFFGDSNLKFNQTDNFSIKSSKIYWSSEIFKRTNAVIEAQRSVLIFFDTESKLMDFEYDYADKFDRMNVLTEYTSKYLKAKYIEEAGIAGTVTLATRMMGRGVDFKSSVSVEKKGGVHVIQTFFSVDVKEETQIKGRTARKDNKGSYELILCEEHLKKNKLLKPEGTSAQNYNSLHQARLELSDLKGAENAIKIQNCENNHNTTMQYFGLCERH